jgi:hypothetical protein
VGRRTGAVEGEDGDLLFGHLVDACPPVVAGPPDRARDAGGLPFAITAAFEHAANLI